MMNSSVDISKKKEGSNTLFSRLTSIRYIWFYLSVGIQLIILAVLLKGDYIRYATNDDTTIVALLSGAYGFENHFSINMNCALSFVIARLFSIFPVINWVTVFFIGVILISFLAIDFYVIANIQSDRWKNSLIATVALGVCFWYILGYFTFTVVSYIAGIAAAVSGIAFLKNRKGLRHLVVFAIFSILSVLIRSDCIITIIAFMFIYSIGLVILKEAPAKRAFFLLAVMIVIMATCLTLDTYIEGQNPAQASYREWGEVRSSAMDGRYLTWNENPEAYVSAGIKPNQYNAIAGIFYYDYDVVSKDAFETILEITPASYRYEFDIAQLVNTICANVFSLGWDNCIIWFAMIIAIFTLGQASRKRKIEIIIALLTILGIYLAFFIIQRPLFRVTMPQFILLCVVSLEVSDYEYECSVAVNRSWNIIAAAIMTVVLSIVVITAYFNRNPYSTKLPYYSEETQNITRYRTQNNDVIFLAAGSEVLAYADLSRPIFDFPGKDGELWNLMGNWEIYSYPYFRLMEKYGIQNPNSLLLESLDNTNIRYLTLFGQECPWYITQLLYEQYGIKAHFEEFDTLTSDNPYANYRIWILVSDNGVTG